MHAATLIAIHLNGADDEHVYADLMCSHVAGCNGELPRRNLIYRALRLH